MAQGSHQPGQGASAEERWTDRRLLAYATRTAIVLAPLAAAVIAGRLVIAAVDGRGDRWLQAATVVAASVAVGVLLERVLRRFLPVPALLRMTLLFPDRAPSRLAVARVAVSRQRLATQLGASTRGNRSDAASTMLALVAALAAHDRRTRGHCERVRVFADMLADELGLARPDRDRLLWAALLHDIGKLDVAASVLNKPGKLDELEWASMQQHPVNGYAMLEPLVPWLGEWATGILEHHERFDGTGYPHGVAGHGISRAGRIVAVVDTFETMTATRSYQKPVSTRRAREELVRCSGTQFDPAIVRAFLAISLPRLLWATGPLSLIAHLPWLRDLQAIGGTASVAASASAVGTAGITAVVVGTSVLAPGSPSAAAGVVVASAGSGTAGTAVTVPQPGPGTPAGASPYRPLSLSALLAGQADHVLVGSASPLSAVARAVPAVATTPADDVRPTDLPSAAARAGDNGDGDGDGDGD